MKGFDVEFKDLDHYIRVITDRIWEGRRIDDIRLYYSDPCIVETAMGVSTSVQDVIDGTRATLAMFPDRRLLAEDVIQSGDEDGGFLSSHRIISPMTHMGDGSFGKATARKVHARTIADCVCINNRIVHEWLVRDHAAIALQIGTTPRALAQTWLEQRGGWHKPVAGAAPDGYVSHVSMNPLAQAYAQWVQDAVNGKAEPADVYDEAALQISPGEHMSYGHAEIAAVWCSLFGAMQIKHFAVEHLALQSDATTTGKPTRLAMRFRVNSAYCPRDYSIVRYGKHSVSDIEVLGIVHAEFVQGRVIREWLLLDDVAIWMQVLAARQSAYVAATV